MPYKLALLCVLLPLTTVHLTLAVSLLFDNLHPCIPYWSNCHSISATGRQYPEFFIFKALMIPTAVLMIFYWLMVGVWLKQISNNRVYPRFIVSIGCFAAVMFIVYIVTLGAIGERYALARRIGVIFYFGFSSLGHLLVLLKLHGLNTDKLTITSLKKALFYLCFIMLTSAAASAIAGFIWEGWNNWENAYEWWFALMMIMQFYIVAGMWKKTGFSLAFNTVKKLDD